MNLQIKGTKYKPTPEIVEQAERQAAPLAKLLSGKGAARAMLELERAVGGQKKGDIWRAELTVTEGKKRFRAESLKAKLDHAVTTVMRDVAQELRRAKTKAEASVKKGGAKGKASLRAA